MTSSVALNAKLDSKMPSSHWAHRLWKAISRDASLWTFDILCLPGFYGTVVPDAHSNHLFAHLGNDAFDVAHARERTDIA